MTNLLARHELMTGGRVQMKIVGKGAIFQKGANGWDENRARVGCVPPVSIILRVLVGADGGTTIMRGGDMNRAQGDAPPRPPPLATPLTNSR